MDLFNFYTPRRCFNLDLRWPLSVYSSIIFLTRDLFDISAISLMLYELTLLQKDMWSYLRISQFLFFMIRKEVPQIMIGHQRYKKICILKNCYFKNWEMLALRGWNPQKFSAFENIACLSLITNTALFKITLKSIW